jgi:hypothetical protein
MTTATLTGADVRLRDTVIHELDWDSEVDDSAIGVTAKDGVVTLTASSTVTPASWPRNGWSSGCAACAPSPTTSSSG